MTAPVRIEAEAWGDLRFATLARLLGLRDADHALIKVARIWSWQTEHYTPEAPTYVVDREIIDSALGEGGADVLVRARLAEEMPEGFRMKGGTPKRIEWLYHLRIAGAKGGQATKAKWQGEAKGSAAATLGHVAVNRKADNNGGPSSPGSPRPTLQATLPATLGPLTLTLDQDLQRDQERDPDQGLSVPGADPDQGLGGDRVQRTRLVNRFLSRVNTARVEVATAHKLGPARPITLMDDGGAGERDLRARLAASATPEADLEHVLDVAIAEASDRGELRWLSWSVANVNAWRSKLAASVAEVAKRAPARRASDAIGAARPRADHPDEPGLKAFGDL